MNSVAFYIGNIVIYWNGIVIALGILAGFFLSTAIYTAHSGRGAAMWAFLPLAVVLSVFFTRLLHYFCYPDQYTGGLFRALFSYSEGSFCLPGAIPGILLAGLAVSAIGFADTPGDILDAAAPGTALAFAFVRLSALFNNTIRGKIVITNPSLQHLPLASFIKDAAGKVTWRFASFFVSFMLLVLVAIALIFVYYRNHNVQMKRPCRRDGNIARLGLVLWGVAEIVCESTRFDAPHLKFSSGNAFGRLLTKAAGFVGTNMVIAAVCILCVFVHYSKMSVRANGVKPKHWILWVGFVLSLACIGGAEYLYQRFAYVWLYGVMAAGIVGWISVNFAMFRTCRK